jgi:hypothetical protein
MDHNFLVTTTQAQHYIIMISLYHYIMKAALENILMSPFEYILKVLLTKAAIGVSLNQKVIVY